jgi:hypothetical protein
MCARAALHTTAKIGNFLSTDAPSDCKWPFTTMQETLNFFFLSFLYLLCNENKKQTKRPRPKVVESFELQTDDCKN